MFAQVGTSVVPEVQLSWISRSTMNSQLGDLTQNCRPESILFSSMIHRKSSGVEYGQPCPSIRMDGTYSVYSYPLQILIDAIYSSSGWVFGNGKGTRTTALCLPLVTLSGRDFQVCLTWFFLMEPWSSGLFAQWNCPDRVLLLIPLSWSHSEKF